MGAPKRRAEIVQGVGEHARAMMQRRIAKVRSAGYDTMSVNPLLIPMLYEFHGAGSFAELGELLLAWHLMTGHATSFGKLVDEKILPDVFGTTKLTARFRAGTPPFLDSCFNDIDHLVSRADATPELLSLKMSRWTIQLGQAVGLNHAFARILGPAYEGEFQSIAVGVAVGRSESLTDKYDILRGINRGKIHDVVDLSAQVKVLAGREFWAWLNEGETETQDWVLEGILSGVKDSGMSARSAQLLDAYKTAFSNQYAAFVDGDGEIDWIGLLARFSG